jgi:tyrosine-protein kinase Etk/Wzc
MGNIHASFTPQSGPGLCELLRGAHLHEVVIRGVMHGVDLIPRGGVSPNAADLLASVRLTEILRAASERYDAVVVDTPPVLAVTDATLLAKQAGTTLLVVRHGMHPVSEESEALNRLRDSGVTVSGTLFTDVPDDRFGYGSRYGNATRYTRGRGKHDDITA